MCAWKPIEKINKNMWHSETIQPPPLRLVAYTQYTDKMYDSVVKGNFQWYAVRREVSVFMPAFWKWPLSLLQCTLWVVAPASHFTSRLLLERIYQLFVTGSLDRKCLFRFGLISWSHIGLPWKTVKCIYHSWICLFMYIMHWQLFGMPAGKCWQ